MTMPRVVLSVPQDTLHSTSEWPQGSRGTPGTAFWNLLKMWWALQGIILIVLKISKVFLVKLHGSWFGMFPSTRNYDVSYHLHRHCPNGFQFSVSSFISSKGIAGEGKVSQGIRDKIDAPGHSLGLCILSFLNVISPPLLNFKICSWGHSLWSKVLLHCSCY